MKTITLCADDYGLSPAVSSGILDLLSTGRLHAVSCFTSSPYWPEAAGMLKRENGPHEVGLHFNLTHPFTGEDRPLVTVLSSAACRNIDRAWVIRSFNAQWKSFLKEYGRPPDFIDGHQHVHSFPVIRDLIIERMEAHSSEAWLRSLHIPREVAPASPKNAILKWASRGLRPLLHHCGIRTNSFFGGLRPYTSKFDFRTAFRDWLEKSPAGTLIMCHPGRRDDASPDPISLCRTAELDYLASARCGDDAKELGILFGTQATNFPPVSA